MRRLGLLTLACVVALAGCATAKTARLDAPAVAPAGIDVTGRWVGTWNSHGVANIPRDENAVVELTQAGGQGSGWVWLDNTGAAEGVPVSIRRAGAGGVRVNLAVSGSRVAITHELGARLFALDFDVTEGRMVGRVRGADPAVRIVLTRVEPQDDPKPQTAAVSPAPEMEAPSANPEPAAVVPPLAEARRVAEAPASPPTPAPADVAAAPGLVPATTLTPAASADPEPAPSESAAEMKAELKAIYFDFSKAEIRPGEAVVLDANAQWLKENADREAVVEGHADERGSDEFNRALGERRAQAVRDYLVGRGIEPERITTASQGEAQPTCSEQTEDCFAQNRRAEFVVKPR
jgi:peptidoglycan-associated lipoprotein